MDFKLSKEHQMLQKAVRDFCKKQIAPNVEEWDKEHYFPYEEVMKPMGELGFWGTVIPEEYGGEDMGFLAAMIVTEELARVCSSLRVQVNMQVLGCAFTILRYGTEEVKKKYIEGLCSGELIGGFGITEPDAGSDPVSQTTTATRDGDTYVLNGTKRFITSGKNCGVVIVTAKTDEALRHKGISAFIVPKDTPGLIVGHEEDKMGLRASDTTDLIFENCRVPAENLLGKEGQGFKIAMAGLDGGRIGIAAQSIGVAQAALDSAVKYAKKRDQFGQPISKFQGLRWIIADMATQIEAARQLMLSAAAMKDRGEKYSAQASMAKLFASEMVNRITANALQIHGGYGFTKDYEVERYFRDARVFTIYEGTSEIQRIVISNHILKDKRRP